MNCKNTFIIWVIGLPNSGKTLLAEGLTKKFNKENITSVLLDGDDIRKVLSMENKRFLIEDRKENARRIGRLASLINGQGINVIVAANTMFHDIQRYHREHLKGYFEIYMRTSEKIRRKRDEEKKIYERFDSGELKNVLGLDLEAEEPENPDVIVNNEESTLMSQEIDRVYREILKK